MGAEGEGKCQTPSTGLRHSSFGGRCRKAVLGVWGKGSVCVWGGGGGGQDGYCGQLDGIVPSGSACED